MPINLKEIVLNAYRDSLPSKLRETICDISLGTLLETDALWQIVFFVEPVASSDINHLLMTIMTDMRSRSSGAVSLKKFYLNKKAYQTLVGKNIDDMPQVLFMRKPVFQSDNVPDGIDIIGIGESKFDSLPYDKLLITGRLINE